MKYTQKYYGNSSAASCVKQTRRNAKGLLGVASALSQPLIGLMLSIIAHIEL
jgi:hypothetical protein